LPGGVRASPQRTVGRQHQAAAAASATTGAAAACGQPTLLLCVGKVVVSN